MAQSYRMYREKSAQGGLVFYAVRFRNIHRWLECRALGSRGGKPYEQAKPRAAVTLRDLPDRALLFATFTPLSSTSARILASSRPPGECSSGSLQTSRSS